MALCSQASEYEHEHDQSFRFRCSTGYFGGIVVCDQLDWLGAARVLAGRQVEVHCGDSPLARSILPRRQNSGANPDNDKRHRQGGDEGDDNRQGERAKQIYLMAHVVYRHAACSIARKSKLRRRYDAVTASLLAHCIQKVHSDGAQRWLTEC